MPDKVAPPVRQLPGPGDMVARKYRIERRLGQGGMGAVFLAHHELLHQSVAIKFLLPELAEEPSIVARFLNEARASAQIRDEHAVIVHDVETLEDGNAYMVLEFLDGTDLATLLTNNGPLAPKEAIGYTLQALQAVARAHSLGIVHRDLKPANLFLATRPDAPSVVKVLDFGISKMSVADPHAAELSKTGATLGTLRYMPPEQIRDAKTVDERADIWAVGVILYLLLTGKPPFQGGETEVVAAILEQTPPPVSSLRAGLPPEIDRIVERCLRKNRNDRYRDVGELAADLAPLVPEEGAQCLDRIRRILAGRSLTQLPQRPDTAVDRARPKLRKADLPASSPESDATVPPPPLNSPGSASVLWGSRLFLAIGALAALGAIGFAFHLAGIDLPGFAKATDTPTRHDDNSGAVSAAGVSGDAANVPSGPQPLIASGKRRAIQLASISPSNCPIDKKWLEAKLASMSEADAAAQQAADELYLKSAFVEECLLGEHGAAETPEAQSAARAVVFNHIWQTELCQLALKSNAMPEFAVLRDYLADPANKGVSDSPGQEILTAADRYLMYFLFGFVSHSEGAARYREELEQIPGARAQLKQLRLHDSLDSDTVLAAALYLRRWNPLHPENGKASRQESIALWRAPPNAEIREKAGLAVGALKSFLATGKPASREQFLQSWNQSSQDDAFFERMTRVIRADHRFLFRSVSDALVAGPAVKDKDGGTEIEVLVNAIQDYYSETGNQGAQPDRTRLADTWGHPFLTAMDSIHRGMGKLVIDSTPTAEVIVDGVDTGRATPITALEALELPAGDHSIVLKSDDKRSATRAITVVATEFAKIANVEDFK